LTYRPFTDIINAAASSSTGIKSLLVNNSGSTIPALTPVRLNSTGQLETIDVSNDTSVLSIVGLTEAAILDWTQGAVMTQGKLSNITTGFNFGDYIYISKAGAGQVNGPISTGVPVTLPSSKTYISNELEVYLNGQRLSSSTDYSFNSSTSVAFTFDILVGDLIRFRIDRPA